jgi:hypothetical protein
MICLFVSETRVKMEIPRLAESAFGDDPMHGALAMRRNVVAPLGEVAHGRSPLRKSGNCGD